MPLLLERFAQQVTSEATEFEQPLAVRSLGGVLAGLDWVAMFEMLAGFFESCQKTTTEAVKVGYLNRREQAALTLRTSNAFGVRLLRGKQIANTVFAAAVAEQAAYKSGSWIDAVAKEIG